MTCTNSFLFWLLTVAAVPGVVLGAFFMWVFVEGFRIYFLGKR